MPEQLAVVGATESDKARSWNSILTSLANPHLMQTWEWAQVKARYGWQPILATWSGEVDNLVFHNYSFNAGEYQSLNKFKPKETIPVRNDPNRAAALILYRPVRLAGYQGHMGVMYVPKGPNLVDWRDVTLRNRVLQDLGKIAKQHGAFFIKIDPDVPVGTGLPGKPGAVEKKIGKDLIADLVAGGWHFSQEQVQFRNTVLLDLSLTESGLLAGMKSKTRYNIRLARRKGVTIRTGSISDLELLYRLYAETSLRDGFVIRDENYYHAVWQAFLRSRIAHQDDSALTVQDVPVAEPLIAEVAGQPVAALILFRFADRAWFLYGMSTSLHREMMPNYLLQWEAIQRAKASGCAIYDLWGAPNEFDESDPLWSVYRFKEGLGGEVVRTIGAWDLSVRPLYYWLYTQVMPRVLAWMRRRGRSNVKKSFSSYD
jgi:peptidoglycan pentaglycine glycine transferase (the first glycine)